MMESGIKIMNTVILIINLVFSSAFLIAGNQLEHIKERLNNNLTSITNVIPNMYIFNYDGGNNNINDGGYDMYDGGNKLSSSLSQSAGSIVYTSGSINNSSAFGTQNYFTEQLPGLFFLAANLNGVEYFQIDGNLGADGSGVADGIVLNINHNGTNYMGLLKRVRDGSGYEPTINHLIIVEQNNNINHEYSTNTDNDYHKVYNLSQIDRLYYLLYASRNGSGNSANYYIDDAASEVIMSTFLNSVIESGLPPAMTSIDITGTSGFRMLSSPVPGAVYGDLLEELYTQGMTGSDNPDVQPNVWTYNNSWNALTDLTTDNYTAGSGVLVYVFADTDFDGTDDLPVTLTLDGTQNTPLITIATNEDSWNLLGNPYGYSLSIQQLAIENSGYGPVYIWDSAADAYKSHNGTENGGDIADGLIAPFQGFFSYAAAGATSYTFTENSISAGTGTNYRTAVESEGSGVIAFTSGDKVSEVFMSFNLTGDLGMDHADAYRLLPLSHNDHLVSMFYVGDEAIAVNNLPYDFNADLSVDLDVMHLEATDSGFDPVSETVTMTWDLSDVPEGMNIVMMNNETNAIINLHEIDEYTFTLADKDGFELEENVVGSYPLVGQSQFTMFMSSATAASHEAVLPDAFTLQSAYPNPFNPSTTIRYSIPETGSVLVKVYDLSGREVSTLVDRVMPAGYHSLSWNPSYTAAAGIYIVQVINGKEVLNQKITYLK